MNPNLRKYPSHNKIHISLELNMNLFFDFSCWCAILSICFIINVWIQGCFLPLCLLYYFRFKSYYFYSRAGWNFKDISLRVAFKQRILKCSLSIHFTCGPIPIVHYKSSKNSDKLCCFPYLILLYSSFQFLCYLPI